jgi:hypothetical protein
MSVLYHRKPRRNHARTSQRNLARSPGSHSNQRLRLGKQDHLDSCSQITEPRCPKRSLDRRNTGVEPRYSEYRTIQSGAYRKPGFDFGISVVYKKKRPSQLRRPPHSYTTLINSGKFSGYFVSLKGDRNASEVVTTLPRHVAARVIHSTTAIVIDCFINLIRIRIKDVPTASGYPPVVVEPIIRF